MTYYAGNGTKFVFNRLDENPAEDGFDLYAKPLFQAAYGTQWFVHCLYTIRSTSDKPPVSPQSINRDKRSANSDFPEEDSDIYDYHHAVFDPLHNEDLSRVRRSLEHTRHAESSDRRDSNKQTRRRKNKTKFRDKSSVSASDLHNIGVGGRGTNMRRVPLASVEPGSTPEEPETAQTINTVPRFEMDPVVLSSYVAPWAVVATSAALLMLLFAAIAGIAAWCRSRSSVRTERRAVTISVPHGNSRVIVSNALPQMYGETSEV
ncbi:unnamed protein product [Notodromas monacha]|uniref:Uncharacterized protein n=1 Tax=Notodromas monacha TaxID=399045 RepID=A0A7R9BXQ8_9CRUS|nr:unnamed protein product [Notodromas monacha]CAG0923730.1 unnamed protein product [Notodromas monacha]